MGKAFEVFVGAAAERFQNYVERLAQRLAHADRREPLRGYLTGLVLPGARKSVEPMAAWLAPTRVRQIHQSLHHLVAEAPVGGRSSTPGRQEVCLGGDSRARAH